MKIWRDTKLKASCSAETTAHIRITPQNNRTDGWPLTDRIIVPMDYQLRHLRFSIVAISPVL